MKAIISCVGLNIEQNLSYLVKKGVVIHSIERQKGQKLVITVEKAVCPIVVDYLKEKCYNDITVRYVGWANYTVFCKKHIAIMLVVLLLIPVLFVNNNILQDIVVEGNYQQQVIEALSQYGISLYGWIGNIDYDSIENYLCSQLHLNYCVVSRQGNVLYVKLIQPTNPIDTIDYSQPRNIYATHSGIVDSITVVQGTARVSVGQSVSAGELLVEGVRTFADGTTEPVYAIAMVVATVTSSATVPYTGVTTQLVDSGEVSHTLTIDMARHQVISGKTEYQLYRTQSQVTYLYPLNIKLTYNTHYEQLERLIAISWQDSIDMLQGQALALASQDIDYAYQTQYTMQEGISVTATVIGHITISDNQGDQ